MAILLEGYMAEELPEQPLGSVCYGHVAIKGPPFMCPKNNLALCAQRLTESSSTELQEAVILEKAAASLEACNPPFRHLDTNGALFYPQTGILCLG